MLTKNVEAEALGTNGALAHAQVDPWRTSQLAIGLLTGMHRDERYEPALRERVGGPLSQNLHSGLSSKLHASSGGIENVDPSAGKREDGAVLPADASPGALGIRSGETQNFYALFLRLLKRLRYYATCTGGCGLRLVV